MKLFWAKANFNLEDLNYNTEKKYKPLKSAKSLTLVYFFIATWICVLCVEL